MEFPQSESEARAHIAGIRRQKGLGGSDVNANASDLEAALILLSEELYHKPTHFLLELLQNADDNKYETDCPTVQIQYSIGHVQLSCNEVGFRTRDVDALCRIVNSTKTAAGSDSVKFIGEKGIGFKSVFKVADVVWVKSGHYSFKFDKRMPLGMITPEWSDFPRDSQSGFTSILLQISPGINEGAIVRELQALEPRILIFLNRLRTINIKIENDQGPPEVEQLIRQDIDVQGDTYQRLTLQKGGNITSYLVTRHTIPGLPSSPKRPGQSSSEILLAFPVLPHGSADTPTQQVCAFLPIRDYGFKFLIQGDFLLTASREDIDASASWNIHIAHQVPYAFVNAVERMRGMELEFEWPRYISQRSQAGDIFDDVETTTIILLQNLPSLLSLNGHYSLPGELIYVCPIYRDEDGSPMTASTETCSRYLDKRYLDRDWPLLSKLRVTSMDIDTFLKELDKRFHTPGFADGQSARWHSLLSQTLLGFWSLGDSIEDRIRNLKMIPTSKKSWTIAYDKSLLLPTRDVHAVIPKGINVALVHRSAVTDKIRYKLLRIMGVEKYEPSTVCGLIMKTQHSNILYRARQADASFIKEQSIFVFKEGWLASGWTDRESRPLLFPDSNGDCREGSSLYCLTNVPPATAIVLGQLGSHIYTLHPDYDSMVPYELYESWLEWLEKQQKVNRVLRIFVKSADLSYDLSPEFDFIVKEWPGMRVLHLLKSHWSHYGNVIAPPKTSDEPAAVRDSRAKVVGALANISVTCKGDITSKLKCCLLPWQSTILPKEIVEIPIIDIPFTDIEEWKFLEVFGVGKRDITDIVLDRLKELADSNPNAETVVLCYQNLWKHGREATAEKRIRSNFQSHNLIYIPPKSTSSEKGIWTDTKSCIWTAPSYIRKIFCLCHHYPGLKEFFQDILRVDEAESSILINEMHKIEAKDDLGYISRLFVSLSLHARIDPGLLAFELVKSLCEKDVFPIETANNDSEFSELRSARSQDLWFIADRPHLRQSFRGSVPLLAFPVEILAKIETLLEGLPLLRMRLLSQVANGEPSVQGTAHFHSTYTESLRSKARFIASLVSKAGLEKATDIIKQLRSVKVFEVKKMTIQWSIRSQDGQEITGAAESGRVKVASESGYMAVYLQKSDAEALVPPLELGEEICAFCHIKDADKGILLQQILVLQDVDEIRRLVERRGLLIQDWDEDICLTLDSIDSQPRASKPCPPSQSDDNAAIMSQKLQRFLDGIDRASSIQATMAQRWETHSHGALNPIVSRICRLEDKDASVLLPASSSAQLDRIGATSYDEPPPLLVWGTNEETPATDVVDMYPAMCIVTSRGHAWHRFPNRKNPYSAEVRFLAELTVSRVLESHLGDSYSPQASWTSPLRTLAGHKPLKSDADGTHAFHIRDDGSFSNMLKKYGYTKTEHWKARELFRVDVATSTQPYNNKGSEVMLDGTRMRQALTLESKAYGYSYILAVVFDVWKEPRLYFFVNPWRMIGNGSIRIRNPTVYRAHFQDSAPKLEIPLPGAKSPQTDQEATGSQPMDDKQPYKYQPLNGPKAIRLLKLKAGTGQDKLEGTLVYASLCLTDCWKYVAISYQWGVNLKPCEILTPEGIIPITSSLNGALLRLRKPDADRLVWADAICINQDDNYEKCVQIRLMAQIFQEASSVQAWIGEEGNGSNEAMKTLLQILTFSLEPTTWPQELDSIPSSWEGKAVPPDKDIVWQYIERLLARGWFKRAWIAQEVVLAKSIFMHCGSWEVNLDDIFKALRICMREKALGTAKNATGGRSRDFFAAYALGMARKAYANPLKRRKFDILTLMELFSYTESTLTRDKLFSLLQIANDATEADLNPDYDSSEEHVIRRYAEAFIRRGQTHRLLARAGASKSYRFCTWIPEWTRADFPPTIANWYGIQGPFRASGGVPIQCSVVIQRGPNVLHMRGVKLCKIKSLSPVTLQNYDAIAYLNSLMGAIEKLTAYPTGETVEELQLRIPIGHAARPHLDPAAGDPAAFKGLMGDDSSESLSPDDRRDWGDSLGFDTIPSKVASLQDLVDLLKASGARRDAIWRYWQTATAFAKRMSCAQFCVTEGGYAGLVPPQASVGHRIAILHGIPVPFVVGRRQEHGIRRIIGECYIHGIMYGEASKPNFPGAEEVEFRFV